MQKNTTKATPSRLLPGKAIVLVNLGTPANLSYNALRRYLAEFLMDNRVINLAFWRRWLLVNLIIAPLRPWKIKKNYQKIWFTNGSPLKVLTADLTKALQKLYGKSATVSYAMRYGEPSLKNVCGALVKKGVTDITLVPLYPHYASATIGSVYEKVFKVLAKKWHVPTVKFLSPYYQSPEFIYAVAEQAKPFLNQQYDGYLFSYHSLPKDHLTIGETGKKYCRMQDSCCSTLGAQNSFCYRAHCWHTTQKVRETLKLPKEKVFMSFQSRLGFREWIRPYTTDVITAFPAKGIKKILVFSPSFVTDCIETLEELGHEEKENFLHAGGTVFQLVPCVNASPLWAQGLQQLIEQS